MALHIRSHLRWFEHLTRMPPGHLLGEVYRACPTWKRPLGQIEDMLEILYLLAGLGTHWCLPWGAGRGGQGASLLRLLLL